MPLKSLKALGVPETRGLTLQSVDIQIGGNSFCDSLLDHLGSFVSMDPGSDVMRRKTGFG